MDEPMEPVAPRVETLNEETEEYVEPEQDQINEIESDQENAETEVAATGPISSAPKKPKSKPPTERVPGQSLLPLSRVSKIMKADKELGATAKEAIFLVAIAAEEFIKRLGIEGHNQAIREGRSIVMLKDLATAVRRTDELLFLQDIIPHSITASTAHAKRSKPEAMDPALGPAIGSSSGPLEKGFERMRVIPNDGAQAPVPAASRRRSGPPANSLAIMMQNTRKGKGKEVADQSVENGSLPAPSPYQLRPINPPQSPHYTDPVTAPLPLPTQLPPNARPPPPTTRSTLRPEPSSDAMDTS